jgi:protein ImuA
MHAGPKTAVLHGLRQQLERLERAEGAKAKGPAVLPFGLGPLDALWPQGGLPRGALHEVACDHTGLAPATGFTAWIAGRLKQTVLWCTSPASAGLYAPGLAAMGLPPQRLLIARTRTDKDALAAMEEALRHGALGAVVGEIARLDLTSSRRLQLAAEKTGTMTLILRRIEAGKAVALNPIAAASRWRIAPAPSAPAIGLETNLTPNGIPQLPGRARWRLALVRSRHGTRGSWIVEAPDAQGHLHLPALLADRGEAQALEDHPVALAAVG